MLSHAGDFISFMESDTVVDKASFEKYCDKIANTSDWGGHLELHAMVRALQIPVIVYSATSPEVNMGEEFNQPNLIPLQITYHKHYYALGEHYNSVVPLN